MDFISVLQFLVTQFQKEDVSFALIGGFALQAAGVTRSTRDIDLLVLAASVGKIKEIMLAKGYELLHESPDVLNFLGTRPELGRVDFLLAHRKYALAMLDRAKNTEALGGKLRFKTAAPEDIVGLKVQAIANVPERRDQDMADIRSLLKLHRKTMDLELVRDYFRVFNMELELENLLKDASNAPES